MPTSSDAMHVAALHFPSRRPLSVLERVLLPRQWSFSQIVEESSLPDDPVAFLGEQLAKLAPAGRQATPDAGQSDAAGGGTSLSKSDLVEFAIQTWRLQRRVDGMDRDKHKREYKQFSDSVRRFVKILQRFEVEFEDPTGKPFTAGWLEVEVVSWDDPGDEESPVDSGPWVKQTISPIIRQHGITIKTGQVVCVDVEA